MNIALDISPLKSGNYLQHRVRGTGFYTENLKSSFVTYFPQHTYTFVSQGEAIPDTTDVIHYPYFEPFFKTLPFWKRFPSIATVHDLTPLVFPKYFPAGIKGMLKWQVQNASLKRLEAIITDSISSKKDIICFTGISESKIHTIPLAAGGEFKILSYTREKEHSFLEKYHLPKEFALYVGDITWNKNLPRLIEAINLISVPLVLVGKAINEKEFDATNPWNKDRIEVQRLISGNKNIYSLGYLSSEDLVFLYNIATMFVMPSLYEGFGLPILEAMQCGCPVITTHEGSLKEVAGSSAYFVNPYNVVDISKGIREIFFNQRLRKDLSEKGKQHVKQYSWKKTAEKTLQVYQSVI